MKHCVRMINGRLLLFIFFISCLLLPPLHVSAQVKNEKNKDADLPPPRDVKVLDEHKDAKGNTIRTIEYLQNGARIRETIVIPATGKIGIHVPINPDTLNKDSVLVVVNKSHLHS